MSFNALRFTISMPNAHFRIIQSSRPQKTYPVPPYSTVIGFLANLLGNEEQIELMLQGDLVIGVLCKHDFITREYTWLRNLQANTHRARYGSLDNRGWQEVCEHIGGQSPVSIEVLNDVHLVLYVYHPNRSVLETLQKNACCPEKWYSHLHLGRAEDWAMIESAAEISLIVSDKPADLRNSNQYYQWMPDPAVAFGLGNYVEEGHYRELFEKTQGPATLVTSLYRVIKVPYHGDEGGIIRNFEHIPSRLSCMSVPFLNSFMLPAVLADLELSIPVYMANIGGNNNLGKGG